MLAPRARIAQGVGFLSEDRKSEGLALARSIEDNVTYSSLKRHARRGWLRLKERRAEVARWLERLHVSATGPAQSVAGLSGGNQQKVALARLLHQQADVLLLDEPTRGIDVGSKAEIYRLIGELAAQGKAILVVSSYLPELFGICDRIAVMARGRSARPRADLAVDRARSDGGRHPHRGARQERRTAPIPAAITSVQTWRRSCLPSSSEKPKSELPLRAAGHARLGLDGLRPVSGPGADHTALRGADTRVGPVHHA